MAPPPCQSRIRRRWAPALARPVAPVTHKDRSNLGRTAQDTPGSPGSNRRYGFQQETRPRAPSAAPTWAGRQQPLPSMGTGARGTRRPGTSPPPFMRRPACAETSEAAETRAEHAETPLQPGFQRQTTVSTGIDSPTPDTRYRPWRRPLQPFGLVRGAGAGDGCTPRDRSAPGAAARPAEVRSRTEGADSRLSRPCSGCRDRACAPALVTGGRKGPVPCPAPATGAAFSPRGTGPVRC